MDLLRTDGIRGQRNGGCEREDPNCLGKSSESTEDVLNKSEVNQAYKFFGRSARALPRPLARCTRRGPFFVWIWSQDVGNATLRKKAGDRIRIMAGGGIREYNVRTLALKMGVREVHTSSPPR